MVEGGEGGRRGGTFEMESEALVVVEGEEGREGGYVAYLDGKVSKTLVVGKGEEREGTPRVSMC